MASLPNTSDAGELVGMSLEDIASDRQRLESVMTGGQAIQASLVALVLSLLLMRHMQV
jgi:hypothetical protein